MSAGALVFGKFLPPHAGHLRLIEAAREVGGQVAVLVCSLVREPIPGTLRAAWLRELVPWATVIHVTDENPQEPDEHPDFWEIWTATLRGHCPLPVRYLVTSEAYGDVLAPRLGLQHVCVDPARSAVPVSGSAIRRAPARHWQHIPVPVRPFALKRVVVTGPESTGKTTLAERLAAHFGTTWVPEFARDYLERRNAERGTTAVCLEEDIEPIARGQLETEDEAARQAQRVLFCDTDLIVTKLWSEHYFGRCADWIREAARTRRYDLHLQLDVDVPWVLDPLRDQPNRREHFRELFRRELRDHGSRVVEVSGSWDERFARAVAAVEHVLDEPWPALSTPWRCGELPPA